MNVPLPIHLRADLCTQSSFRVVRRGPGTRHRLPYGFDQLGGLSPEHLHRPATESVAWYHLVWWHVPTPFTSVFNNIRRALNWGQMLAGRFGIRDLDIVVIDTCNVPAGSLWDAHGIALHLVPLGFPQHRVALHEDEYLFYGPIEQQRVLAVLPLGGSQVTIPVHLGQLRVPQAFVNVVGSAHEGDVRDAIMDEVYIRCGYHDRVRYEQALHALCSARFDDVTVEG